MSGISSIGSGSDYGSMASGQRINSAAEDASGLAIAEKLESQATGLDVGADNAQAGINVINVADGALSSITDSLQRMKELSLKAMNGTNGASELSIIQGEIDQIKEGIQQMASNTEFNSHKLLDGSMADMDIATNPDGTGSSIQLVNSTLESLGIADFDVTGDFDMTQLDGALDMVSDARSSLGATSNSLQYAYNNNVNASLETKGAKSKIEDLDFAKAISEQKKTEVFEEYRMNMIQKKMEQESLVTKIFQ